MEILTPLQKTFIHKFSESPFCASFYLTGGTALAAFYLEHRLSEDLDFFTAAEEEIRRVPVWLNKAAQEMNLRVEILRHSESFMDCFFESGKGELLNVDFALDAPFRLQPTRFIPEFKIQIDNLTDIACNKLSALFDRAEPKDFVDLYFLDREFLPFSEILDKTRQKHIGLDDYWMAQALFRVREIEKLPRMLKDVPIASLKEFFLAQAEKLMRPPS